MIWWARSVVRTSVVNLALGVEDDEVLIDGDGEDIGPAVGWSVDLLYWRLDMMVVAVGEED
jgi:hypothetical protein